MTQQEIQKAAMEERCDIAMTLSNNRTSSIDLVPYIDYNLSYDEIVEQSFIKGVKWALNNKKDTTIWHTPDIEPEPNSFITYIDAINEGYLFNVKYNPNTFYDMKQGWNATADSYKIIKWAYTDDIINL